ncbi:MAG: hypothetical protein GX442_23850 [Candidatus Riflebacteria bacterium]|nr:hypothetical protein [Candidatus Riflebacteria bacterium]
MAKDVRQALAELVARKDAAVFQDAERFTRAMEAATGAPSAEITALAAGLTARLPWTLRKVGDANALGNLAADLQHTKGMTLAQAWWTIDTWAHALVISLPPRAAGPSPVPPPSPGAANPVPSSPRSGPARTSPVPAPPPAPAPAGPAGPPAISPAPVSPLASGGTAARPEAPAQGMPSSSAPARMVAVPPPSTPMGIEFLSGADGLVRVTRVWSDPSLVRSPGGLALAETVKAEEAGPRSLPGTPVVPADPKPARKKAAAPSPTGSSGPPVPPPPAPPVRTADSGRPTGRVAKGQSLPAAPFFHFDPAGKAPGATPVPRAAPPPPARPPVDKHLGPTPATPPVPVPTPASAEDQYQLARDLLEGRGRPANLPEGIRLLRLAAAQDHVPAFYTLGMVCLRGFGMTEDPAEAATWFRKSAEKGNADAMVQLGTLYQCGHGIPADLLEARRWFVAASQKGHPEAAALLKTLPL